MHRMATLIAFQLKQRSYDLYVPSQNSFGVRTAVASLAPMGKDPALIR